jgi:hypothetical protein
MNTIEVTAIVKDVIVHYALPFTLVSVSSSERRWEILVRAASGRTIPLSVADGRPHYVRETVQEKLEAQL